MTLGISCPAVEPKLYCVSGAQQGVLVTGGGVGVCVAVSRSGCVIVRLVHGPVLGLVHFVQTFLS